MQQPVTLPSKSIHARILGILRVGGVLALISLSCLLLVRSCYSNKIARFTWITDFTTVRTPHIMWLHGEICETENCKWIPLFKLRMPKSYTFYQDNHRYTRQSKIGILVDKKTFEPIAEVIVRENKIDSLHDIVYYYSLPGTNPKIAPEAARLDPEKNYRARSLFISLDALGLQPLEMNDDQRRKTYWDQAYLRISLKARECASRD
jgi:hypothetical protein